MTFKSGEIVAVFDCGLFWFGQITVTRETESKFLPDDSDCPLNYWYVKNKDLIKLDAPTIAVMQLYNLRKAWIFN